MNLRDLMSWGLINKQLLPGERKEYFLAEKDIWKVARQIAKERKRREMEPILETMEEIQSKLQPDTDEKKEVLRIIGEISQVTNFTNSTVNSLLKAEESWLVNNFLKLFK
ncbi:MAG: DNA-binding transcriptional regulator GbsR (MarR family) [Psychromonas sp.]|jgi:DNA-binding transcriptional regulator GbsR (MarR family)